MDRLLVTGGSGFLGSSFRDVEGQNWEIIFTHHQNPDKDTIPLDVTNKKDFWIKLTICIQM